MKMKLFATALMMSLGLSTVAHARGPDYKCTIRAYDGHYLTAVEGGGNYANPIHTDARVARAWEYFIMRDQGEGSSIYAIQTSKGYYLSAVGGGGRTTNAIKTNATSVGQNEKFIWGALGGGRFSISTLNGHYITAVDSGGRTTDVLHTDATRVLAWEEFRFDCKVI